MKIRRLPNKAHGSRSTQNFRASKKLSGKRQVNLLHVIVADNRVLVRELIVALLAAHPNPYLTVSQAATAHAALSSCQQHRPPGIPLEGPSVCPLPLVCWFIVTPEVTSGSGNINETVAMPAGSHITYKATGTISPSATGSISDTATVTTPSGVTDPNSANNTATDTDTL